LDTSIQDGAEGLMIKTLHEEANYTPAKRSHYWFKLKKDYMDGVTDTLDLVPIAAYHGKGKRAGVFGGFLLACYNPVLEEYQSICKLGTGLSDQDLENMTAKLSGTVIRSGGQNSHLAQPSVESLKPSYYNTNDKPDVWLRESMVWEIKAADLSISPAHMAAVGLVDDNKGIALRFPRFIRVRDDKEPTDATSAEQVADMYRNQALATKAAEINLEEDE
jgi:DNA ligase-1